MKTILLTFSLVSSIIADACMSQTTDNRIAAIDARGNIQLRDGSQRHIAGYADPDQLVIFAVRHCEKAKDQGADPDLTAEGQARAEKLGRILQTAGLDAIFTTRYKRTRQTGEAVARHYPQQILDTLPLQSQQAWAEGLWEQYRGKKMLYVGHQNTVPQLLNQLSGRTDFQNLADHEFGRFFVIVVSGKQPAEVQEYAY
jgi:2,3-bisphosphoglycerate-dependent phosphoglycerate mutase